MKWTEKETIQVPTTVDKVVETECMLVVHKKREGASYEGTTHHEYTPATEADLRRAAESLGLFLSGPFPHCTCGANLVCGAPQHRSDCAVMQLGTQTGTIVQETGFRR